MAQLHLVRHGHASAGWGTHRDPGLDELGVRQSQVVADQLAELSTRRILSSPLLRAVETSQPLAARWGATVDIDPAFGEIPSPTDDLALRKDWLRSALSSHWVDLDEDVGAWRARLLAAVRSTAVDTVAFTHFVAINAVVADLTADAAVTVFLPANTSVTVIDIPDDGTAPSVVQLGSEATPEVG